MFLSILVSYFWLVFVCVKSLPLTDLLQAITSAKLEGSEIDITYVYYIFSFSDSKCS